jgi:transketolase
MRDAFCKAMMCHAGNPDFVFLTGDLGFKALEPLRASMSDRFINAGVAEQNMICLAAGLTRTGMRAWAYSIAPFIYARPFEQIRNNVALPGLPVILVGNGGGYGYGVMGSTHHSLEDYGVLLTLPNMRALVPAFDSDLAPMIDSLMKGSQPAYLRLGLAELPEGFSLPGYAPWRKLISGDRATLLVVGPLVGGILAEVRKLPLGERPSVWLVSELPLAIVPPAFIEDLAHTGHLVVVEEHVKSGGLGQMISHYLLSASVPAPRFTHHCAQGYVSGFYGSQRYHRRESQLDPASILGSLTAAATRG